MNWFLWLSTSAIIVVAALSLLQFRQLIGYIDGMRKRGHLVSYMAMMSGWIILLMYGLAWLLWMLHLAGLPVASFTSWLFDLFVIH